MAIAMFLQEIPGRSSEDKVLSIGARAQIRVWLSCIYLGSAPNIPRFPGTDRFNTATGDKYKCPTGSDQLPGYIGSFSLPRRTEPPMSAAGAGTAVLSSQP